MDKAFWFLMVPGIIIAVVFYLITMIGGVSDDSLRWKRLLNEMRERYPDARYTAQLEFIRRDRYAAINSATTKYEDIMDLCEDYTLITDEQERMAQIDRQIGMNEQPVIAGTTEGRV